MSAPVSCTSVPAANRAYFVVCRSLGDLLLPTHGVAVPYPDTWPFLSGRAGPGCAYSVLSPLHSAHIVIAGGLGHLFWGPVQLARMPQAIRIEVRPTPISIAPPTA